MRYRDHARETRQNLVRAAAEVFDRKGFPATNLHDICRKAGVTKGALYFHFSSKDALAIAVMEEQGGVWQAALEQAGDSAKPGLQSLIDLSYTFSRQLRTDPVIRAANLLVFEAGLFRRQGGPQFAGWITVVRALLMRAREDGDLENDLDVNAVAESLVGGFTGSQLLSRALTGNSDLDARTTQLWQLWIPAMVPTERRNRIRVGPPEGPRG
ncbi:TetR/AcrR family transcriptional regulator [Solihabitans fulvus]|uniref:TetR/AcrR family transcriptional regulator n=1 Tax=Solihabitans fulvus TaxID=1892852 RepID=A0A5B2WPR4_9PSEU|nr:ScbR family autoregulator-binding transcription factor [Solihabitans fulvus]KAA2252712.1 TetR/AcrR family transcriptional regulator [Solihabitans fulvus]